MEYKVSAILMQDDFEKSMCYVCLLNIADRQLAKLS